jgi:hypothetical protein
MERGIERSFLDLELVFRGLFDSSQDGETVHRSPGERLEDEQIECAANEVDLRCRHGSARMWPET